MKLLLKVVGAVFIVLGGIWVLQGINILPGSFMTGQMQWAIYGAIAMAVGVVLFLVAPRLK
jgi:hypothetical protein